MLHDAVWLHVILNVCHTLVYIFHSRKSAIEKVMQKEPVIRSYGFAVSCLFLLCGAVFLHASRLDQYIWDVVYCSQCFRRLSVCILPGCDVWKWLNGSTSCLAWRLLDPKKHWWAFPSCHVEREGVQCSLCQITLNSCCMCCAYDACHCVFNYILNWSDCSECGLWWFCVHLESWTDSCQQVLNNFHFSVLFILGCQRWRKVSALSVCNDCM